MISLRPTAIACAAVALCFYPKPAFADDALTVVSGSSPSAIFEVIGDVAQYADSTRPSISW